MEDVLALQLGPTDILLGITIDLRDELSGAEIERAARELTERIEMMRPEIKRVFLRPRRAAGNALGSVSESCA